MGDITVMDVGMIVNGIQYIYGKFMFHKLLGSCPRRSGLLGCTVGS